MRKNFFVICLLVVLLLATSQATFADNSPTLTPPSTTPTVSTTRFENGNRDRGLLERERRLLDEQEKRIQEFKLKLEKRENEIKNKIASREAELKEKLAEFKNKKKATIAERVSTNLNTININRVAALTKNLDTMDNLLTKVKTRVANAKANGKDVSKIETAIASVESSLSSARGALVTQAGKDYTLVVSDESKVKDDAKAKRDALFTDLKSVHEKVKTVRQALIDAIKEAYAALGKENVDITVTPAISLTQTSTPTPANDTSTPTQSL